jgi:hypothetical protein
MLSVKPGLMLTDNRQANYPWAIIMTALALVRSEPQGIVAAMTHFLP